MFNSKGVVEQALNDAGTQIEKHILKQINIDKVNAAKDFLHMI